MLIIGVGYIAQQKNFQNMYQIIVTMHHKKLLMHGAMVGAFQGMTFSVYLHANDYELFP
jgi:Na+(H+)/acetate symporter ActP